MAKGSESEIAKFMQLLSEKTGYSLRQHQIEGVEFMVRCRENGHGCVLADEMGLGKTCQALAMLSYLLRNGGIEGEIKYLIVCPLSVLDFWRNEPKKFGFGLDVIVYRGDKEEREKIRRRLSDKSESWNTILTTYELLNNDSEFFSRFRWTVVVIDEAHRLKNMDSILHNTITKEVQYEWILLLTGTPVQNNMNEFYSLLSICHPDEFPSKLMQRFVDRFADIKNEKRMNQLREVIGRYVLRRTKDVTCAEMPTKSEVMLFHNLTNLQKEVYRAILLKNYDIFDQSSADRSKQRLMNTLMQLRKCVNHPYLFEGIEPEPFTEGEHLVEASGKLLILDLLLSFLKKRGHKVLLYSQMTHMLDIIQDYLTFREYSYERLDGSVRGEERFAAINRFANMETFCFLLSTKAGGLGLNLVAADTVIFLDSDFNPQNDLQAAARVHRIGQTRHVKIIRLIGRRTVEEIILARAAAKLKFTDTILDERRDDVARIFSESEINEMLMFGLNEMSKDDRKAVEIDDSDLQKLLGKSENGCWIPPEGAEEKDWTDEMQMKDIYTFEGKDYREESKQADRDALDALKLTRNKFADDQNTNRKTNPVVKTSSEDDVREKRQAAAEKRKLAAAESRAKREEEKKLRLEAQWTENGYVSSNLPEPSELSDEEVTDSRLAAHVDRVDASTSSAGGQIAKCDPIFVVGDVTKPELKPEHKNADAIIVHCVDDSGSWGRGGMFSALSSLSSEVGRRYELAKRMTDLTLGDAHLIEVNKADSGKSIGGTFVALVVAQHHKNRSQIKMDALERGLKRISAFAAATHSSVHMPRVGYGIASFNWYGLERMIRKWFGRLGVPTYIYYYPRRQQRTRRHLKTEQSDDEDTRSNSGHENDKNAGVSGDDKKSIGVAAKRLRVEDSVERDNGLDELPNMPLLFDDYKFYFHDSISEENASRLRRLIVAFGGEVTKSATDLGVTHVVIETTSMKDPNVEAAGKIVLTRDCLENSIKAKKVLFAVD